MYNLDWWFMAMAAYWCLTVLIIKLIRLLYIYIT